ncbi:hypothetical protein AAFF_G00117460 [Aldrovandia affinis]|uniref:Uncharacterized protein n=1 Tax=Aldrovandia affinis TaxID=143900 RepID=A0AAD7T215_9TELE|nr:hypothetical protein AAFF_G00117460 [Aldrovandia affinis]
MRRRVSQLSRREEVAGTGGGGGRGQSARYCPQQGRDTAASAVAVPLPDLEIKLQYTLTQQCWHVGGTTEEYQACLNKPFTVGP